MAPSPKQQAPGELTIGDKPSQTAGWKKLTAGYFGLINLNREFLWSKRVPVTVWLQSLVDSDRDRTAKVSMGWLGSAAIFVNGAPVTTGKKYYDPESERRAPDGRLSLENGSFMIPLHKGRNEISIALLGGGHDHEKTLSRYGWGLEMRFADIHGLILLRP